MNKLKIMWGGHKRPLLDVRYKEEISYEKDGR